MPLSFIFAGVSFILILFDCIKFTDNGIKKLVSVFFILVAFSYFVDEFYTDAFSFDILGVMSIILFLIIIFLFYKIKVSHIIFVILFSYLYYLIVCFNSDYLLTYKYNIVFISLLLFLICFGEALIEKLFLSAVLSTSVSIISSVIEINNSGYSIINFNLFYDLLFGIIIFWIISHCFKFIYKGRIYEKVYSNFMFNNQCNIFSIKY